VVDDDAVLHELLSAVGTEVEIVPLWLLCWAYCRVCATPNPTGPECDNAQRRE